MIKINNFKKQVTPFQFCMFLTLVLCPFLPGFAVIPNKYVFNTRLENLSKPDLIRAKSEFPQGCSIKPEWLSE